MPYALQPPYNGAWRRNTAYRSSMLHRCSAGPARRAAAPTRRSCERHRRSAFLRRARTAGGSADRPGIAGGSAAFVASRRARFAALWRQKFEPTHANRYRGWVPGNPDISPPRKASTSAPMFGCTDLRSCAPRIPCERGDAAARARAAAGMARISSELLPRDGRNRPTVHAVHRARFGFAGGILRSRLRARSVDPALD